MGSLARLVTRLRRRPLDLERAVRRTGADADAVRRALHDDVKREVGRSLGGGGGS